MATETRERWHIGSNTLGNMPDEPPYCMVGTEADAIAAARADAERSLDECDLEDCPDPETHHGPSTLDCDCHAYDSVPKKCTDECTGECHHAECCVHETLDDSGDYWLNCPPAGQHIWYARCDEPDECMTDDHEHYECGGVLDECPICLEEEEAVD